MQAKPKAKVQSKPKPKVSLSLSPQVLEWVDSTRASWNPPLSRSGFIEACIRTVIEIQDRPPAPALPQSAPGFGDPR